MGVFIHRVEHKVLRGVFCDETEGSSTLLQGKNSMSGIMFGNPYYSRYLQCGGGDGGKFCKNVMPCLMIGSGSGPGVVEGYCENWP